MPVINRVADMKDEVAAWRRDIHENPELQFEEHRTAGLVAEKLKAFGCDEVVTGLGRTGVVGVIRGNKQASGKIVGLRADMDALPIHEITGKPYASKTAGKMHACGHDGHTAMLLGAAKYLAETRNFDGTAVLIFQPAEEGGGGAKVMIDDGLMDRFGIQEVYGMHNMPGLPVGQFALRPGPLLAAADRFVITITGKGGHGAHPHACIDPVLVGAHTVTALQSIAARNVNPLDSAVVSVTMFHAGDVMNVIPQEAVLQGTVRTLRSETRDFVQAQIVRIAEQTAALFGAKANVDYRRGYPVTANHAAETDFAVAAAAEVVGPGNVDRDLSPTMGAEDFSYMLEARPGAFVFVGNGDSAGLHHPAYDFNDEALPVGISYWAKIVETRMAA